ncbi:MAG: ABC transporter ATP-binding protein [Devosiaceae bacterium]|nr:ABC transporter ATP-binding protein [Devosiaceae bacterium MH13]
MDQKVAQVDGFLAEWGTPGTQPASVATAVSITDVHHQYGETPAVRGVSLTIEPGEIVCLLGHSGCGKTTLLRLLAGVEQPTEGTIKLDQRVVAGPSVLVPPEKREVGLMFQDFALFPHLTIAQNVRFGLTRLSAEDADKEVERALRRVGLLHVGSDYPHMLSGGMQQRAALARAMAPRPRVMLMDEPFSGLDRRTRDRVRDETLAILREMRATTIVVTHDPDEALRIADRIVLMRGGKVVQDGHARSFYDAPADLFAARFFHDFNEFEGPVVGSRVQTPLGAIATPGLEEGASALVGVRQSGLIVEEEAAGGAATPARVQSVQFLGEGDLLRLAVPGYERPVYARTAQVDRFHVDQTVWLSVHRESVLVFEKTPSDHT